MAKMIICSNCGRTRVHDSHGLCGSCAAVKRMKKNHYKHSIIICAICGEEKEGHAKGLCAQCYRKEHKKTWKKKIVVCKKCGKTKTHMAHGLCTSCYLTKEMLRRYRHRRESKRKEVLSTLTVEEWKTIFRLHYFSCAYCGIPLENPVQEHWIPSSRGGGYTSDNIVPACAKCNSRKRTMTGDEYKELLIKEFDYARSYDAASR